MLIFPGLSLSTCPPPLQLPVEIHYENWENRLAIIWWQDILKTYKRHDEWFILTYFGLSTMLVVGPNGILQDLEFQDKKLRITYIWNQKSLHFP